LKRSDRIVNKFGPASKSIYSEAENMSRIWTHSDSRMKENKKRILRSTTFWSVCRYNNVYWPVY